MWEKNTVLTKNLRQWTGPCMAVGNAFPSGYLVSCCHVLASYLSACTVQELVCCVCMYIGSERFWDADCGCGSRRRVTNQITPNLSAKVTFRSSWPSSPKFCNWKHCNKFLFKINSLKCGFRTQNTQDTVLPPRRGYLLRPCSLVVQGFQPAGFHCT